MSLWRATRGWLMIATLTVAVPSWCATLKGTVVDHVGATQPQAKVVLRDAKKHVLNSMITENDGRFQFPNLTGGEYRLSVTAACFGKISKRVLVSSENDVEITVQLGPEKPICHGTD